MTDQTDQDAREAREWAEYITSLPDLHGGYLRQARAVARFILDNTDSPLPDPLFLARATHPEHGEGVVVSARTGRDGYVRFMFTDERYGDGTSYFWVSPSTLTFHTPDMSKNGAEIDTSTEHVDPIDTTPDHPEFLETEEDYRSAPEGTIVAADDYWPFARFNSGWITSTRTDFDYAEMAGIRRRVLRWGWEA